MALTIGSNIASLKAQQQLVRTSNGLSSVFERLASGQRINRASDDAAGLAIADSLRADTRVYSQAIRNLNDGISLLNIADSALQNLTSIVIRIQELTEQAANGSYGGKQREALDAEAQALSREYLRIAQSTEFNGRQLFSGNLGQVHLQAGIGEFSLISSSLGGAIGTGSFGTTTGFLNGDKALGDFNGDGILDQVTTGITNVAVQFGNGAGTFGSAVTYSMLGGAVFSVTAADFNNDGLLDIASGNITGGEISIRFGRADGTFGDVASLLGSGSVFSLATGDFNGDGHLDLVAGGGGSSTVHFGNGDGTFAAGLTIATGAVVNEIAVGDFNGDGIDDFATANSATNNITIAISNGSGGFSSVANMGVEVDPDSVATADFNGDGNLDLVTDSRVLLGNGNGTFTHTTNLTGTSGSLTGDLNGDGLQDIVTSSNIYLGNGAGSFTDMGAFSGSEDMVAGDLNGDGVLDIVGSTGTVNLGLSTNGVGALLPFSLATLSDARQAIAIFARKRDDLSEQRGIIGAFQSRIEFAGAVLETTTENFRTAESRIRDADIASDSSELVRLSILREAAAAVLGQANQQPSLVLKLLNSAN